MKNELVCKGRDSLVPVGPDFRKPMELDEARRVLQTIVSTHENSFNEASSLDMVGEFDAVEVWEALRTVSEHIVQTNSDENSESWLRRVEKETSKGDLSIVVYPHVRKRGGEEIDALDFPLFKDDYEKLKSKGYIKIGPESLQMRLEKGDDYVLDSEVPLIQLDPGIRQSAMRFSDFREGTDVSMYNIVEQGFTIEKFQYIWRGIRWVAANMLDWNGDCKLPEDLDKLSLPPQSSEQKLLP